jgi:hypothetical protein
MENVTGTPAAAPTKHCTTCGRVLDARAELCPGCGVRQAAPMAPAVVAVPVPPLAVLSPGHARSELAGALGVLSAVLFAIPFLFLGSRYTSLPAAEGLWAVVVLLVSLGYLGGVLAPRLGAGILIGLGLHVISYASTMLTVYGGIELRRWEVLVFIAANLAALAAGIVGALKAKS